MITVQSWGIAGALVDRGRPGRAWLGASRRGALDLVSHALAHRLVGNPETAACIETSGGLVLLVHEPVMVAVTGAVVSVTVHDGPPLGWGAPVVLPAGAQVHVHRLVEGARAYLAVRGGLRARGNELVVGVDPVEPAATMAAARRTPRVDIEVWPGPRSDWFLPEAMERLLSNPFVVATTSRVGTRLHGLPLERVHAAELASEGMVEGAIQVPPDGQPIVMLADHPTTGGYPVIAVVGPDDVHHVAQAAPGTALRFHLPRRRVR
jgi:allophanate hydrolase subunit 2